MRVLITNADDNLLWMKKENSKEMLIDVIGDEKPDVVFIFEDDPNFETKRQICYQKKVRSVIIGRAGHQLVDLGE